MTKYNDTKGDRPTAVALSKVQKAQFVLELIAKGPEKLRQSQLAVDLSKLASSEGADIPTTVSNLAASQLLQKLSADPKLPRSVAGQGAADRALSKQSQKIRSRAEELSRPMRQPTAQKIQTSPDHEHPAIVAHRLLCQPPEDRKRNLEALHGHQARQVKFMIWQLES